MRPRVGGWADLEASVDDVVSGEAMELGAPAGDVAPPLAAPASEMPAIPTSRRGQARFRRSFLSLYEVQRGL